MKTVNLRFEVEFGNAVCDKLGVKPDFVEINWDAKENELNSKRLTAFGTVLPLRMTGRQI